MPKPITVTEFQKSTLINPTQVDAVIAAINSELSKHKPSDPTAIVTVKQFYDNKFKCFELYHTGTANVKEVEAALEHFKVAGWEFTEYMEPHRRITLGYPYDDEGNA